MVMLLYTETLQVDPTARVRWFKEVNYNAWTSFIKKLAPRTKSNIVAINTDIERYSILMNLKFTNILPTRNNLLQMFLKQHNSQK